MGIAMRQRVRSVFFVWLAMALAVIGWPALQGRAQTIDALADPGPYIAGWREVIVPRMAGGEFAAMLYYPAVSPGGANAAIALAPAHAAIAFGHGFQQPVATYSSTLVHLATWGFIVIAPRSYENSLLPNHSRFADDLIDSLSYLSLENQNSASWLYQAVGENRFGVSGHSMGGGASLLAADRDPRILAVANMAAAETIPSAVRATAGITRPVQLIAGSSDTIVPAENNQMRQYDAGNAPKQAPLIVGGSHCNFQDYSVFSVFCDTGLIPKSEQLAIMRQLLTAWFLLYLYGDDSIWQTVWGPASRDASQPRFTGDAGIVLAPATTSLDLTPGEIVTITFAITNTQPLANSYAIDVMPPLAAQPSVTQTASAGSGEATRVSLIVTGTMAGAQYMTLTARSMFDGGTTAWANLTTTIQPAIAPSQSVTVNVPLIPNDTP